MKSTKQLDQKIKSISSGFNADERETSVLLDHYAGLAYLETTKPSTARRWIKLLNDDPNIKIDHRADSLKISVPLDYCRKGELMLQPKHRKGV